MMHDPNGKWYRFSLAIEGQEEPLVSWVKCDPRAIPEALADYSREYLKGKMWSINHVVAVG